MKVLFINILSLNVNYNKLQIFIEGLIVTPDFIICTKIWLLEHVNIFS